MGQIMLPGEVDGGQMLCSNGNFIMHLLWISTDYRADQNDAMLMSIMSLLQNFLPSSPSGRFGRRNGALGRDRGR